MLVDIKKMFQERKILSLYELSIHFEVESSAMEQMLERLIDMEEVKKKDLNCESQACGGCSSASCDPAKMIFYEKV